MQVDDSPRDIVAEGAIDGVGGLSVNQCEKILASVHGHYLFRFVLLPFDIIYYTLSGAVCPVKSLLKRSRSVGNFFVLKMVNPVWGESAVIGGPNAAQIPIAEQVVQNVAMCAQARDTFSDSEFHYFHLLEFDLSDDSLFKLHVFIVHATLRLGKLNSLIHVGESDFLASPSCVPRYDVVSLHCVFLSFISLILL
jgi:hypothetical protein